MTVRIRQITQNDIEHLQSLMAVFGTAFSEEETYTGNRPGTDYLNSLLSGKHFIALAAIDGEEVIGGLAAYVLEKFEQERSEILIYDLAVSKAHRRKGVATALIKELKAVAARLGAYLIFVQADTAPEDRPAIELYSKLAAGENILHFEIAVEEDPEAT